MAVRLEQKSSAREQLELEGNLGTSVFKIIKDPNRENGLPRLLQELELTRTKVF